MSKICGFNVRLPLECVGDVQKRFFMTPKGSQRGYSESTIFRFCTHPSGSDEPTLPEIDVRPSGIRTHGCIYSKN